MFKIVLALAALSAMVTAEPDVPEAANRFLAVTRTSTALVISTTTIPTTVVGTCFTTAAAITACRRRRALEELPLVFQDGKKVELSLIQPTQTQAVTITAAPAAPAIQDETEILSSANDEEMVLDNGLARKAFLTLYYTTTSTVLLTSYSTVTSGAAKTFTIAACTPVDFRYPLC